MQNSQRMLIVSQRHLQGNFVSPFLTCQKYCSQSPLQSVKFLVQLQMHAIATAAVLLVKSLRDGRWRAYISVITPKWLHKCGAGSILRKIKKLDLHLFENTCLKLRLLK